MAIVIRPADMPRFPQFTRQNLAEAFAETGIRTEGRTPGGGDTAQGYLSHAVEAWLWELKRRKATEETAAGERPKWRDLTAEEIASGMRDMSNALRVVADRTQNI